MMVPTWLAWVLTAVFAVSTLVSLRLTLARQDVVHRVSHTLHIAMGVAMIAMAWGWDQGGPTMTLGAGFAVAGAWYVLIIALRRGTQEDRAQHPDWIDASHAAMMATMAWMYLAMAQMPDHGTSTSPHHHANLGAGLTLAGTVALAAMIVSAIAMAWDVADPPRAAQPHPAERQLSSGSAGLMSFGMAAMVVPMLWV